MLEKTHMKTSFPNMNKGKPGTLKPEDKRNNVMRMSLFCGSVTIKGRSLQDDKNYRKVFWHTFFGPSMYGPTCMQE